MLDALRFVQGSVAKKDFVPALQHFRIKDGTIKGYNGNLSLCCPIDLDLDITPKAIPFIKAVATCREAVAMSLTPTGKLSIRSGKFRALVDCETEGEFPDLSPEGEPVTLPGGLLPVLKKLAPFIADDASRQWARGILFRGQSAFATNNIVLLEQWMGVPFPVAVNIPRSAVVELLRIGQEPLALQVAEGSVTFHFEGGGWMRTQVYDKDWPDVQKVLAAPGAVLKPIPEGLLDAVTDLSPFVDEQGRIFLRPGVVATTLEDGDGAAVELGSVAETGCFNHKHLLSLADVAETIDLSAYPKPCPFRGELLRGALVGIRM